MYSDKAKSLALALLTIKTFQVIKHNYDYILHSHTFEYYSF